SLRWRCGKESACGCRSSASLSRPCRRRFLACRRHRAQLAAAAASGSAGPCGSAAAKLVPSVASSSLCRRRRSGCGGGIGFLAHLSKGLIHVLHGIDAEQARHLPRARTQRLRRGLVLRDGCEQGPGKVRLVLLEVGHCNQLTGASEPRVARGSERLQPVDDLLRLDLVELRGDRSYGGEIAIG